MRPMHFREMKPRAVRSRVMAMGRPARPASERLALIKAAAGLDGSARQIARHVGAQVAAIAMRDADTDPQEAFANALARATREPTPAETLALSSEFDVAAMIGAERVRRYSARGCRQLSPLGWEAETRTIERRIAARLAGRYSRLLRNKCA